MGLAKRHLEEIEARGYDEPPDKYVCANCFNDYGIKVFIKDNLEGQTCDYCKRKSSKLISSSLGTVIGFLIKSIEMEWGDPNDEGVGWASREGGWLGAKVVDSYDLLQDEIGLEVDEQLFNDIVSTIYDRQWCHIDPYSLQESDNLIFDWHSFSDQVKHRTRYVFYRVSERNNDIYRETEAYEILERLGKIVNSLDIINVMNKGIIFIRARTDFNNKKYTSYEELGPPILEDAVLSNRMSPAGIPMFYGTFDRKIAIAETRKVSDIYATTVKFEALRNLKLLDLTIIPNVPSLFDESYRHKRQELLFLHNFVRDISRPLEKDGHEHIEYVPTQVVTEYFRHVFKDKKGDHIDGIIYPSARIKNGKSCVLFFKNENCIQDNDRGKNKNYHEKVLMMITSSIKQKKLKRCNI